MILIAILFPGISFLLRGRLLKGVICIILQATLIGWIPAAVWAIVDLLDDRAQKRNDRIVDAMRDNYR